MIGSSFEWDEAKDIENQQKPGASFYEAQYAFRDENRAIAEDLSHSEQETRYYCFGLNREASGILTVGFTYRVIEFVLSVPDTGEKVKNSMSKRIQYRDEPLGESKRIPDFLPSPEGLSIKTKNKKITITLSAESVAYFKEAAKKHHMQYQKMIRQLLDEYVAHQKGANRDREPL